MKKGLLYITIFILFTSFAFAENNLISQALKYKKAGDWGNATSAFLSALEKNSNCAKCYFHLGEIEENKLNYIKALFYYEKASLITPHYYARLGYCYQTTMNWEKSVDAFNKYLNFFPEEKKVSQALGISYRKSGNIKESKSIFKNILKKNPKDIISLFNMSKIYSDKGDRQNAMLFFEQYKSLTDLNIIRQQNVEQR